MTDKFVPESVLARLVVGQRVRYMPDGECAIQAGTRSKSASYGATLHEGYSNAEGQIGRLMIINDDEFAGHPYRLHMDEPFQFAGHSWNSISAAAHELALVED